MTFYYKSISISNQYLSIVRIFNKFKWEIIVPTYFIISGKNIDRSYYVIKNNIIFINIIYKFSSDNSKLPYFLNALLIIPIYKL